MEFKVEKMNEEDALEAKQVIAQSYFDTYINDEVGVTKEWIESFREEFLSKERIQATKDRLTNTNFASWVAKNKDNKIIGVAIQYVDKDGIQNLMALYIDKEYLGEGVAHSMMESVMSWFNKKKDVILGIATYNDRARAFYKKWGFKEIIGSNTMYLNKIPEIKMIRKGEK